MSTIDDVASRSVPQIPLLQRELGGRPLVFLDNASTTPKPRAVIDAVVADVRERDRERAPRRALLGEEATRLFDDARREVATSSARRRPRSCSCAARRRAINFVANGLELKPDDEVVFPASEHHANWIPWRVHSKPVPMPIDWDGVPAGRRSSPSSRRRRVSSRSATCRTSRARSRRWKGREDRPRARVPVLLDAARSLSHLPIDVAAPRRRLPRRLEPQNLRAERRGHLYGKKDFLQKCPLYQVGGGMISLNNDIDVGGFVPRRPFKFEAGTPAIEATIGFGAVRWDARHRHGYDPRPRPGDEQVPRPDGLGHPGRTRPRQRSSPEKRIALATFVVDAPAMTQESVARALLRHVQVCVSAGFHCTRHRPPRLRPLPGTVRASPHVFNTAAGDRHVFGVREIAS